MTELDRYSCEEVFRRLDDYVDRELSAREMEVVHRHLQACDWCAREYEFEKSVIRQVRASVRRLDLPAGLKERISGALLQADRGL
jgi:anti-sigma factor (TIGR02949 family)